jgi:hypothetical protein
MIFFKKYFISLIVVLSGVSYSVSAQPRYDINWIFGAEPHPENPDKSLLFNIDFSHIPPRITQHLGDFSISSINNAAMSSKEGDLIFFTNGCRIAGGNYRIMPGGEAINKGKTHDEYCNFPSTSYPAGNQCVISLPMPGDDSTYYLLHNLSIVDEGLNRVVCKEILATRVSWHTGSNRYTVARSDSILLKLTEAEDYIHQDELNAVLHSNNRDYWIIVPTLYSHAYHVFLLDVDGIHYTGKQIMDFQLDYTKVFGGQGVFSPDGNRFARVRQPEGLLIFDFDRSTGKLTYKENIPLEEVRYMNGVAISPNSRYAYVGNTRYLFQYDLEAPDIAASRILVAEWDGTRYPGQTVFAYLQLAPDCKIYGRNMSGTRAFHVIHEPDLPGLDCRAEMIGFELGTIGHTLNHAPHYRTAFGYASYCDSIKAISTSTGSSYLFEMDFTLFPNPSSDQISVIFPSPAPADSYYALFDIYGHMISRSPMNSMSALSIPVQDLKPGIYHFYLYWGDERIKIISKKFVKI